MISWNYFLIITWKKEYYFKKRRKTRKKNEKQKWFPTDGTTDQPRDLSNRVHWTEWILKMGRWDDGIEKSLHHGGISDEDGHVR